MGARPGSRPPRHLYRLTGAGRDFVAALPAPRADRTAPRPAPPAQLRHHAAAVLILVVGIARGLIAPSGSPAPFRTARREDAPARLLGWAIGLLAPQRDQWGQAMLGELGHLDGRGPAVALRARLRRRRAGRCRRGDGPRPRSGR